LRFFGSHRESKEKIVEISKWVSAYLVSLSNLSDEVLSGNDDFVEVESAGGRGPDSEL